MKDDKVMELLISEFKDKLFALVFFLIGDDRDKAYDITASSLVEAFRAARSPEDKASFLIRLISIAIEKSRTAKIIPFSDETEYADFSTEKRKSLLMVKKALQELPFNEKALLLLPDQLHLPHGDISAIFRMSEGDIRSQTVRARIHIRKKVEEVLSGGG